MKKTVSLLLCCAVLFSLCACGASNPSPAAEQRTQYSGSQLTSQVNAAPEGTANPISMEFVSDDGLIQVSVHDDNADPIPSAMPVLRVRPRSIPSDMARQMAKGVFGDAELFEFSEELSKSEVAEMIAVWENAITDEAIRADHGADAPPYWIDSVRDARLAILEFYRNAYAYARDEVTPVPCQWKFWPDEHYAIHGFDYAGIDSSYTDNIPKGISVDLRAVTTVDGIPYEFWVNNNERADFRNHSLAIFVLTPDELFAGDLSDEAREARQREWYSSTGIFSSAPATDAEMTAACDRAVRLAADMGLGEWIFSARLLDRTNVPGGGWQIELDGQAIYEGFPVSWQNPSNHQDFYLEALTIHIKNDGTVIDLHYNSPMEIAEIMEQNAQLKQWDEITQIAAQAMRSWNYDTLIPNYASEKSWWDDVGAQISETKLDIDSVRVGYTRVQYDSTDFLLVPAISFLGKLEVIGNIPGVHESPMNLLFEEEQRYNTSLVFDLRDGTLIR